MAADREFVVLRSGARVRKDVYLGLSDRLALGDRWWINGDGELFILFGAPCPKYSMSWLSDDSGPQVRAILDDYKSSLGMLT